MVGDRNDCGELAGGFSAAFFSACSITGGTTSMTTTSHITTAKPKACDH